MNQYEHPTTLAFAVFLVGLLAESWFSWRFLKGLRRDHPDVWEQCGRRTIWTDSDLISAWPTIRFLMHREYGQSLTPGTTFCERYRARVVVSYFVAVFGVIAFFISLLTFGWP